MWTRGSRHSQLHNLFLSHIKSYKYLFIIFKKSCHGPMTDFTLQENVTRIFLICHYMLHDHKTFAQRNDLLPKF